MKNSVVINITGSHVRKTGEITKLVQLAYEAIIITIPTVIISTELDSQEIIIKLYSFHTGISEDKFLTGDFNDEEKLLLDDAEKLFESRKFKIWYLPYDKEYSIDKILKQFMLTL